MCISSLRDGRSIRTVSALLLQLVQTSAHDVRIQAKKIDKARQNRFALRRQESLTESQTNLVTPEPFLDDNDHDACSFSLFWFPLLTFLFAGDTAVWFWIGFGYEGCKDNYPLLKSKVC